MVTCHLRTLLDLGEAELNMVLDLSELAEIDPVLRGRGAALLFDKPSLRTRHATEMAITQLGGHPVSSIASEAPIDIRESAEDFARTLSQYHALIGARVFEQSLIERLANASSVPVVNLLSNTNHPLQALADLLTIRQEFTSLENLRVAWIGDFTNVGRSLAEGVAMSRSTFICATPEDFAPTDADFQNISNVGSELIWNIDPSVAVVNADVVVTDCWYSMGQESQAIERASTLAQYQVNARLMKLAKPSAIFLHCLPAHRGQEVTADVIDGPQSRVWQEAQNRMHTARGAIAFLLNAKVPSP